MRNRVRIPLLPQKKKIRQFDSDPPNPSTERVWVLKTGSTYQLSYETDSEEIIRLTLS